MGFTLPKINIDPKKFAKSFALRQSKRWCENGDSKEGKEYSIWAFLNQKSLGPEGVKKLMDENRPLFSVVFKNPNIPQSWKDKIAQAPKYGHYVKLMNYEDVLTLLPDWFGELVRTHPNAEAWFSRECESLKLLFGGI